ncbi:MAG: hypothetical protein HY360_13350 [Verrucomicrobia bacterium]|nr:hypothetical protein [Verrucomicrobiota bacterium]
MASEIPQTEYEGLLEKLSREQVKFIVVGGAAVILNGYHRLTLDVDLLLESSRENLERLIAILSTFGEGYARELKPEDFRPEEGSIRVADIFDIDLFVQMKGLKYEDMIAAAKQTLIENQPVPFLNPTQLIALKKDSYREKDQLDVRALTIILREQQATASAGPSPSGVIEKVKAFFAKWRTLR